MKRVVISTSISRVSFAVLPLDAFTGKPPPPTAFSLALEGVTRPPFRKPDGLYVFSDLDQDRRVCDIRSPIYFDQTFEIDLKELDPENPIVRAIASERANGCVSWEEIESDYVSLHRTAFESEWMTRDWRDRMKTFPNYDPDLQLAKLSEDGQPIGFCLVWPHAGQSVGKIEPIGTHPLYRRKGIARGMILEAAHRLRRKGIDRLVVDCYSDTPAALALYRSVGFRVAYQTKTYRLSARARKR